MQKLVAHYILRILPRVNREMKYWKGAAKKTLGPPLRAQALSSLEKKRFHAQGGCVYALGCAAWEEVLIPLIIALQTISDYLDNLCDRMSITDAKAFRTLHQAFLDALTPGAPIRPYYQDYPYVADQGYLDGLVSAAQTALKELPGYAAVQPLVRTLGERYCDLQVYKHTHPNIRGRILRAWAEIHPAAHPKLWWWEFAAAAGSTLGIFALLRAATRPGLSLEQGRYLLEVYFPWICSLHILLDYLIDLQEDEQEDDLNFVAYYFDRSTAQTRLNWLLQTALQKTQVLDEADFHTLVVKALPALYLSDNKVRAQNLTPMANQLLQQAGNESQRLWQITRGLRFLRQI